MSPASAAEPTDRLFLALRPDAATAGRIHRLALGLRDSVAPRGTVQSAQKLHVTLCFLGDHAGPPASLVAAAEGAATGLPVPAFDVEFDRVLSLAQHRRASPLVLCAREADAPLQQLHDLLVARLAALGFPPVDARPFLPHLTLLQGAPVIAPRQVEPVCWRATEVLLVRSRIGRGVHEVIARCPFSVPAPPAPSTSR